MPINPRPKNDDDDWTSVSLFPDSDVGGRDIRDMPKVSADDGDWTTVDLYAKPEEPTGRTIGGTIKDIGISVAKGVVGLGEAAVGLADIPTFGIVGKTMEGYLGYDPKKTQEFLSEFYSPEQKRAFGEVEQAVGFLGTIKESLKHPSTIGHAAVESFPLMLGGAAAARGLLAIGMKSPLLAGAIGEGIVSAGAAAEQTRQQTEDGLLTAKQALIPAISGAGTAMFSLVGGRVAQKLGLVDVDTFLAGGGNVTSTGVIKRIIGGGISEGAFEELPQSMQEQVWLNAALDKPLMEGVAEAGATGMLAGAAMGAGFNIFTGRVAEKPAARDELLEDYEKDATAKEILTGKKEDKRVRAEALEAEEAAAVFEEPPVKPKEEAIRDDKERERRLAREEREREEPGRAVPEPVAGREEIERGRVLEEAADETREIAEIKPIEVKPKEPKIEKPKVAEKEPWEMTVKELAGQESGWFKEKQYLIPKDKFKKIGIERNYIKKDGDYYNILANGEIGDKVAKEILDKNVQESIESHRYYVEKAISEGKPVPKEVLAEYPDLAPAKTPTPKPPEPTPPEAIEKEIKAKPIPEVGEVSPRLVEKQKVLEGKIESLKNRIDQAEKTAMPGTFVTGRENVPRSRIRKLEAQLDKRIDSAVEYEKLKKELTQIESQIKSQEEAPKRKRIEEKVKTKLEEQFDTIKVGDRIDVGGNNILTVTKKNPKSVLTERGVKWTADEIIKVMPKVAPRPKKEPKVEAPAEKAPTKPEPGKAWIKGKQKPILSAREITRGKNKGKYEITLTRGRDAEGNIIPGAKKIVEKKAIITMPEVAKPPKEEKVFATKEVYRPGNIEDAIKLREESGSLETYDKKSQREFLGNIEPPKNGRLTIYRATPTGQAIKPGDYVTNSLEYAKLHIESNLGGKGKVAKIETTLDDIFPADAPKEFWFAPKSIEKFFATKTVKPQDTITRQDLQSIFGKMKNLRTGVNPEGNFYFKVEGRPAVEILEVDSIGGYINTDKGRIPVGSYLKNTIELKTGGKGFTADINTAFHEYMHFLERNGIVTPNDIKALDGAIGKAEVTEEDRATYVGDNLADWKAQKNTRIKRILKKISDFANAVYEFFTRTRTARGVLRDIEAGRILRKEPPIPRAQIVSPAYQQTAERFYSQVIKTVEDKMPTKMQASAVIPWLRKQPGIKPAELEWMGIEGMLEGKKVVGKNEFVELLRENEVKVKEVAKKEDVFYTKEDLKYRGIEKQGNVEFHLFDVPGNVLQLPVSKYKTEKEARDYALTKTKEYATTKFAQYQLPGEKENYRELLFTLPSKGAKEPETTGEYAQLLFGKSFSELREDQKDKVIHQIRVDDASIKRKKQFRSPHWEEPNVFAHVRTNERTDADGNRILFIEEIQSDWAAKGRKEGYETPLKEGRGKEALKARLSEINKLREGLKDANKYRELELESIAINKRLLGLGIPDMPFKKNWHEVVLKRMIRQAAEQGFDKIAWITGEQTADRYDLSKHVEEIEYEKSTQNLRVVSKEGVIVINEATPQNKLEGIVGKEIASKIEKGGSFVLLKGLDLKVGGEWAYHLYDKMIPQYLKKFGKKYGAEIGTAKIEIGGERIGEYIGPELDIGDLIAIPDSDLNAAQTSQVRDVGDAMEEDGLSFKKAMEKYGSRGLAEIVGGKFEARKETSINQTFTITPELKRAALFEGMPLFQAKPAEGPTIIKEKFGRTETTIKEKIDSTLESIKSREFWDSAITQTVDKLHPIKAKVGDKAYKLHRLLAGSEATFSMLLEHGKLEWVNKEVLAVKTRKKGFMPFLEKQGKDWKKLLYWTAAKRAAAIEIEDSMKGYKPSDKEWREKWLNADARKKIFDWAGDQYDPKMLKLAKELKGFNDNVLDIAEQSGLIDPAARKIWAQDFYIPFYRIFEDEKARLELLKAPRKSGKIISAQIKKLKGGEKLGDPLENLFHNWMHLLQESTRNVARAEAFNSAILKNSGIIKEVGFKDLHTFYKDGKNVFIHKSTNDDVLMFQRDGKPVYFRVSDAELFNSLSGVNSQRFDNFVMKLMNKAKRALTYGATFGPAFRVANLLRDTMHTSLIQKSFKPFIDSAKGLVKAWSEDQDFIEFMATGAGFGSSYVRADDPATASKFIQRIMKKEGVGSLDRILSTGKKMLDFWEKVGSASENAARVQLYKTLKIQGKTPLEAAFEARDLLDFTMRGEAGIVQVLIQTIPFLNARMQGLYKLGRSVADPTNRKNFATRGALLMAASLALWAIHKDDDEYKELEDWDKWSYYHFWIGDKHYRIPKPFEVGAIFSSLPTALADVLSGDNDTKHIADFLGYTAMETFAIGIPQAVKPLAEQWANKSFFTGRPIVGAHLKGLIPEEQKEPWTSETLQLAGKLGISPKRAEALIHGYFSVFGMFLLGGADIITHNVFDFPENPTLRIDEYPLLGRFVKGKEPRYTKQQTWFYETLNEIDVLVKTINHYKRTGEYQKAHTLKMKGSKLIGFKTAFKTKQSQLRNINKQIKRIMINRTMSSEQKRKAIDVLSKRRNILVKRIYEYYIEA